MATGPLSHGGGSIQTSKAKMNRTNQEPMATEAEETGPRIQDLEAPMWT